MTNDFNFNFEFVKAGAPIVTISSLGLAFNSLSRSLLDKPEEIEIGFDEDRKAIGVRAHNPNSKTSSYTFESKEKYGWVRVGCKDFVRYLSKLTGFNFDEGAIQFLASFDDSSNMLIIIVDEEHTKN